MLNVLGPAREAGFRRGDRILSVNGVTIASQEEFYEQLEGCPFDWVDAEKLAMTCLAGQDH